MVDLLKHNEEAYEKVKSLIEDGQKKIAVSHATGTGKSYLIAKLFEDFSNEKKLILVPSTYISDQIQALFEKYNIQNVEVILYQKLIKMSDEDIASMNYGVIALDEYHHDTSKVWGEKVRKLIDTHPESIIFGTSATPIRSDGINTIDELFEGNCASDLPLSESIAKKIVPLPKYISALYTLDDELEKLRQKVENATNTSEEKQEFYKKINTMRSQIEKSYGMPIILNKNIKDKEGKYIVFCKNKRHLKEIMDTVIGWLKTAGFKNINAYEVYSDYENKDAEYKAFCDDTSHNLKLLFCVNMLNEGLHLENISGVLLLRPTRSMIVFLQQIGRAIEANNANTPVIIDAVNNFSSAGQGMKLLGEIRGAIAKEKESDPNFDDSGFIDIDTFFVVEQIVELQRIFAEIELNVMNNDDAKWIDKYEKLLRYKEKYGNLFQIKDIELSKWCKCQRSAYKNNGLVQWRIDKLNDVGFCWDSLNEAFYHECYLYSEYLKTHNKYVPINFKEYPKLSRWCARIRSDYKKGKLSVAKVEKLKQLDFVFEPSKAYFEAGINYYKEYKSKLNNIPKNFITADGFNLSSWISSQRNKYKNGKLKPYEIDKLNKVKFSFSINDDRFDYMFNLLCEFLKDNNWNMDVPKNMIYKGEKIGVFVSYLRYQKKKGNLSEDKIKKMDLIKFCWNKYDAEWNRCLRFIVDFRNEHCRNIQKSDKTLSRYYNWLILQKRLVKNGEISSDRLEKLIAYNIL